MSMSIDESTINDQIKSELANGIVPVACLGIKIDQVSGQVQTLADAIQALNSSLQQLHTQLNDLKNVVSAMQSPAAAPLAATDSSGLTTAAPGGAPPVPAEVLYQNAIRDKDGGKPD